MWAWPLAALVTPKDGQITGRLMEKKHWYAIAIIGGFAVGFFGLIPASFPLVQSTYNQGYQIGLKL